MTKKIPPHFPAVLALGLVSQIGQVLFMRELLMVYQGNELSIGLIFSAWLVWVGVGSRLGSIIAKRVKDPKIPLILTVAGITILLPVTLLVVRGLRTVFDLIPGTHLSIPDMAISSLILLAPVCVMLGIQFVLLARVWRESNDLEDTTGAANTYIGEAVGNILGGLLFTFLMVRKMNTMQTAAFITLIMPAAIIVLAGKPNKKLEKIHRVPMILVGLSVFLFFSAENLNRWADQLHWHAFSPHHQWIENRQSKHGAISVLRFGDQYSFFQSGNLVFSSTGAGQVGAELENQDAILFSHFSMVQHHEPKKVLLIGGGLRGVLGEIIKHPVDSVTYIELDEVLTGAAKAHLPAEMLKALEDERVQLIHTDGRLFVKTTRDKFDMLIVDLPDPATAVLNRFYTREFFDEARDLLQKDGVLVTSALSTPDLRGLAVANRNATLYHTLASVFPYVYVAGEQQLLFIASDEPSQITLDATEMEQRFLSRNIHVNGFSSEYFHTMLQEWQIRRINWTVRHHGRGTDAYILGPAAIPFDPPAINDLNIESEKLPSVDQRYFLNTDLKPIAYYYTLMVLDEFSREGSGHTLQSLLNVRLWWGIMLFCLPLAGVIALRIKFHQQEKKEETHFAVLFSVFTTGFSIMTLQIALIFTFQSIYGFIYEIIGIIMAMFMLGLAAGAYFSNRFIQDKSNTQTLAFIQLLIAIFAIVIALILQNAIGYRSPEMIFVIFSLLTIIGGLINGVGFPVSTACANQRSGQADQSAGMVYGMELIGACVGAGLASVVFAPILGFIACCIIASVANFSAFISLLLSRRY